MKLYTTTPTALQVQFIEAKRRFEVARDSLNAMARVGCTANACRNVRLVMEDEFISYEKASAWLTLERKVSSQVLATVDGTCYNGKVPDRQYQY